MVSPGLPHSPLTLKLNILQKKSKLLLLNVNQAVSKPGRRCKCHTKCDISENFSVTKRALGTSVCKLPCRLIEEETLLTTKEAKSGLDPKLSTGASQGHGGSSLLVVALWTSTSQLCLSLQKPLSVPVDVWAPGLHVTLYILFLASLQYQKWNAPAMSRTRI
jgi:hypothetical protein